MPTLRSLTLALLAVLALCGLAAGAALVTDPTGGRLGLSVDLLPAWLRVEDYLVPGIVLAVLFGILPAVAAVLLVRKSRRGWTATTAVGLLVFLWSLAQVVVIGLPHAIVQAGLLILGIVLAGLGVDGGATADAEDVDDADDDFSVDVRS